MLMSEFLTAVHHKLPVKVVVYNNASFGLIPLEAEANGLPAYREGIEFPNPDFVELARACGAQGFRAARPGELRGAIEQALETVGPVLVDCVVLRNEMPNFPHLKLEKIGNYAAAKHGCGAGRRSTGTEPGMACERSMGLHDVNTPAPARRARLE